ncbi:hypothetical protein BS47DRAFT_276810 [Hydnum rufescens UP504]|uniref:Uncharacterized protein n=1 Tax=Hydnum rufescens UP504 TaxID=1448309 RepID=A0A9P6AL64_9AGAM|nr:hypothetical protein BS47DRAFT_276810 [Hydnum rufescens UP504]
MALCKNPDITMPNGAGPRGPMHRNDSLNWHTAKYRSPLVELCTTWPPFSTSNFLPSSLIKKSRVSSRLMREPRIVMGFVTGIAKGNVQNPPGRPFFRRILWCRTSSYNTNSVSPTVSLSSLPLTPNPKASVRPPEYCHEWCVLFRRVVLKALIYLRWSGFLVPTG